MLYLIPTPIGNLEDITYRAVRLLKEVDLILAEDTRKTGILLKHLEIKNSMKSYHAHNEHKTVEFLCEKLQDEEFNIALVSDAGSPGISDPGFLLVRECVKNGIKVESLPGATAFVPALVNSGLACDRFVFEGFLPHKKGRKTKFELITEEKRTTVLYESPHRLLKTLSQIIEFMGEERQVSVSRELTKLHEENVRGTAKEVLTHFENGTVKGEFVIVIEGKK